MVPMLTRTFRVVTFDARGHGRSTKPSIGYGFATVTEDALAVIRATRLRRPVVVGHSWGATVALHLAAHHPRSVVGGVLVDGGISDLRESMDWPTVKERLAPPELAGTHVDEFRRMMRAFLGESLDITPQIEEVVLSVMRVGRDGRIRPRLSRANHLRIMRAIWLQDPDEPLRRLSVPALAILAYGAGDPEWDARKRRAVRRVAASGAPVRVSWIKGIHDLPLQRPGTLSARIERFFHDAVR